LPPLLFVRRDKCTYLYGDKQRHLAYIDKERNKNKLSKKYITY